MPKKGSIKVDIRCVKAPDLRGIKFIWNDWNPAPKPDDVPTLTDDDRNALAFMLYLCEREAG